MGVGFGKNSRKFWVMEGWMTSGREFGQGR